MADRKKKENQQTIDKIEVKDGARVLDSSSTLAVESRSEHLKRSIVRGLNNTGTWFSNPSNSILIIFGVLLLILNIIPLVSVVRDSFTTIDGGYTPVDWNDPNSPNAEVGSFTFYYWYEVFAKPIISTGYFWKPLGNSLVVSVLSCLFAIVFGGGAAFLICRTNLPFKKFISAVFIFPYIMPQWTLALFWKNFFISQWVDVEGITHNYVGELQHLTGICMPQWWYYGPFAISIVLGLHYAPFAYILMGGVLRNMDANLEEAATILNIPKWKTFFKVTIPMLKPAILSTILLVFASAISSYPVAVTLGNPVNYTVLAVRMKSLLEGSGGTDAGMGAIESIVLIFLGVSILIVNQISTSGRKQYTTVSGKAGQASKLNLGKVGKWVVGVIFIILVLFFCIGPMISFFFESLLPNPGDYSAGFTWTYWISDKDIRNGIPGVLHDRDLWKSLGGSVLIAVLCSLTAGTAGLLIGYAVSKKRKSKLAQAVNGLAFFPYLIPSISLSAIFYLLSQRAAGSSAFKWIANSPVFVAVVIGFLKYIPFASRSSLNAMMQLSNEIEEAAQIQNVHWWKRMGRIVFPIQKSAFLSGYLLPFISCMRELNLFVFIGGDKLTLTKYMYFLEDTGIYALENAANLILVIIILIVNYLVTLLTGASIDKGIGGK